MPILIAIALVLALGSGVASNWQTPSGWKVPPKVPPPKAPTKNVKRSK